VASEGEGQDDVDTARSTSDFFGQALIPTRSSPHRAASAAVRNEHFHQTTSETIRHGSAISPTPRTSALTLRTVRETSLRIRAPSPDAPRLPVLFAACT
jgi:hypothetical protein